MKKVLLGACVAVLGCAQAMAADLPARSAYKAPVATAVPFSWTGLYLGWHVGGAAARWNDTALTTTPFMAAGTSTGNNATGVLGGAQIGYDWQTGNMVFGLQGDLAWADIRNTSAAPFPSIGVSVNNRVSALGTVTGRLGWAMDRSLLYVKGGWAWSRNQFDVLSAPTFDAGASDTRNGWTVGLGAEMAVWNNWSVFAEYDYLDFGTRTVAVSGPGVAGAPPFDVRERIHEVKLGANYRFNWTGMH
jgi:outer membrane immunogenic protein